MAAAGLLVNCFVRARAAPKVRRLSTSSAISRGLANLASFFLGGIPMCHGAGGLAAHYRLGARTAGTNVLIRGILIFWTLVFGRNVASVLRLIPLSVLGVLLVFAGIELALMIQDLTDRKELFVAVLMLGLALVSNPAVAFFAGIDVAYALRSKRAHE